VETSVVCVSGLDGSHLREVAQGIADLLGFSVVDEEIILRAAAEGGVEPQVVADAEKRRSFMERAMVALGSSSDATAFAFSGGIGGYLTPEAPLSDELQGLIRSAIEETASRGDVVIVSHAASHAIGSKAGVLRVLVTASAPVRLARVAAERGLSDKDAAAAVEQSDAGRADYLKRFHGTKAETSTQYDVVVNTDRLSVAEAAVVVVGATGR
jgi:cytidylate kinase